MSKLAHSTTPSARSSSVAPSASQRAPLASRNRQTNAATAGIDSMNERMGKPCIATRSARDRPGDRGGKPDQHDERGGVDIAPLQPPGDPAATTETAAWRERVGADG